MASPSTFKLWPVVNHSIQICEKVKNYVKTTSWRDHVIMSCHFSLPSLIIPKEITSHLVYKFTCSCCNATYYGESETHFFVRAYEHLGMTPLTGKHVKNPKKSAICDHILLKSHDASFEDFTIFLKENGKCKLHLKESLLIKREKPELNRHIYSYPFWLMAFISSLLFTYLLIWVNYPYNFHGILSIADSRYLVFENTSD